MMEICKVRQPSEAAEELVSFLKQKQYHITTAESCTGGLIAAGIVDVPGASEVFEEGYITYANRVKEKLLGVREETICMFTVVSGQVAEEMAKGACVAADTQVSISVTGYAGPDDGEDGTPAGTVYIGIGYHQTAVSRKYHFEGDRGSVRMQAAEAAYRYAVERMKEFE